MPCLFITKPQKGRGSGLDPFPAKRLLGAYVNVPPLPRTLSAPSVAREGSCKTPEGPCVPSTRTAASLTHCVTKDLAGETDEYPEHSLQAARPCLKQPQKQLFPHSNFGFCLKVTVKHDMMGTAPDCISPISSNSHESLSPALQSGELRHCESK